MAPAIVPPYLLARIAAVQEPAWAHAAEAARSTLAAPREYRPVRSRLRLSIEEDGTLVAETTPAPDREISDAQRREELPGVTVRREDDPATGDAAVDEAFDGLGGDVRLPVGRVGAQRARRRRGSPARDRALRAGLRQRLLERRADGLR